MHSQAADVGRDLTSTALVVAWPYLGDESIMSCLLSLNLCCPRLFPLFACIFQCQALFESCLFAFLLLTVGVMRCDVM